MTQIVTIVVVTPLLIPQPLDDKTKKELETVLKGFLEPKQVLKLDTKVFRVRMPSDDIHNILQ